MDHIKWIYTLHFLIYPPLFNKPPLLWAFTVFTYQFLTVLNNDAIIFITMQMFPKENSHVAMSQLKACSF